MCAHVGCLDGVPVSPSSSPRHPSQGSGGACTWRPVLYKWEAELEALGWVGEAPCTSQDCLLLQRTQG